LVPPLALFFFLLLFNYCSRIRSSWTKAPQKNEEQQQIQQAPRINSELFNVKVASNVVISAAARMSRFTQRIILQMLNRLQASK